MEVKGKFKKAVVVQRYAHLKGSSGQKLHQRGVVSRQRLGLQCGPDRCSHHAAKPLVS
jgi:hypothetical protein